MHSCFMYCLNEYFRGYGFIEYETAQAAKDAISAMNLFDLGGTDKPIIMRVSKIDFSHLCD